MAILSTLLSVTEPSGFWITIIKAFEAVTNNYVLAIIFLTVVIRLIWSIVDTFGKYSQAKTSAIQRRMQPELEKLKAKYGSQPQVLQQKQNELMKRSYGRSYYTGCLISLIVMGLNLAIFFTLFSGLNMMSAYKISDNYDKIKYDYVNSLNVTDQYLEGNPNSDKNQIFIDYNSLGYNIVIKEEVGEGEQPVNVKYIQLVQYEMNGNEKVLDEEGNPKFTVLHETQYKTDFAIPGNPDTPEGEDDGYVANNKVIINLIQKYFPVYGEGEEAGSKEIILKTTQKVDEENNPVLDEENNPVYEYLYLKDAIQNSIMPRVIETYDLNQEKFLWIANIWIADSPTAQSIVSYSTLEGQIGKAHMEEGEETIYNAFMPQLKDARSRANGYYILPILCVLISVLSILLNNLRMKRKNKKEGIEMKQQGAAKWMQIIMPIMLGIFALFYNSVFAIYMFIGQVMATILMPLQNLIIDAIANKKDKKKKIEENKNVVDYARKF